MCKLAGSVGARRFKADPMLKDYLLTTKNRVTQGRR